MTTPERSTDRQSIEEIVARARPDQILRLMKDLRHPERPPSDVNQRLQ